MAAWLLFCVATFAAEDALKPLDAFIARQVEEHRLPAVSVAVVDRDRVLWAKDYGKAGPDTVYRVGSVSKLFTDLAVMQLVEKGTIDLDEPVTTYAPDFVLRDPAGRKITLRHLMAHRAGLVREPPRGNYFDAECDSLKETIDSLAGTSLVYPVGTRTKYSNAGIALVGHVLEKVTKKPFAGHLRDSLLVPLGMKASSFEPTEAVKKHRAPAVMWTYGGREFPAPTWEFGMSPAASLYSTAADQARFVRMLLNRGTLDGKRVFAAKTLETMWGPQFTKAKTGFGIGFAVGTVEGKRSVGHGGAVYGFATDLTALPDEGLGVIVCIARDCANTVASRIRTEALRHFLAARAGKKAPLIEETTDLTAAEARALAGRYEPAKGEGFQLFEQGGKLFHVADRGGFLAPVKKAGKDVVVDGALQRGPRFTRDEDDLRDGLVGYLKRPPRKPAACPEKWRALIGEYGPAHLPTVILEKDGRLCALVEWFFLYPLTEESANVFRFDDTFGMYHGEKVTFHRDGAGKATALSLGPMRFERRKIPGEDTGTFKIKPLRPVAELRKEALKARPPAEPDVKFREAELVELTSLDRTIQLDVRYATKDNFLGEPVYTEAKASLQRPAAEALVRAHRALGKQGYGLRVFDGFRPWSVTHVFWHATPPDMRKFVANPKFGSRHNRGCAVDLTLYDRKTGKAVEMPGGYDEFSDRSYPAYPGGTTLQRWHREVLRRAMEAEGFTVYEAEWWHFDHKDWRKYPIGN